MASRYLFGTHIYPACKHCEFGTLTPDSQSVLCLKKGITAPDYSCRAYVYDPLRRIPRSPQRVKPVGDGSFEL